MKGKAHLPIFFHLQRLISRIVCGVLRLFVLGIAICTVVLCVAIIIVTRIVLE